MYLESTNGFVFSSLCRIPYFSFVMMDMNMVLFLAHLGYLTSHL